MSPRPTIWADHSAKSLHKRVQEGRRKCMEEQRKERKLRTGKSLVTVSTFAEKKLRVVDHTIGIVFKGRGSSEEQRRSRKIETKKLARKMSRESRKRENDQGRVEKGMRKGRATRRSMKEEATAAA
jgi:hypothetical protein